MAEVNGVCEAFVPLGEAWLVPYRRTQNLSENKPPALDFGRAERATDDTGPARMCCHLEEQKACLGQDAAR